jgi:hypothetical protein
MPYVQKNTPASTAHCARMSSIAADVLPCGK